MNVTAAALPTETPSQLAEAFVPVETKADLDKSMTAVARVTGYCHALTKSTIADPPTPVAWFNDLKRDLKTAKGNAQNWLVNLQPELTAGYNEIIASYGGQFMNYSTMLIEQATPHKFDANPLPKAERDVMIAAFTELLEELQTRHGKMTDLNQRLKAITEAFIKDKANLERARSQAETQGGVNRARVKTLKDKIEQVRKNAEAAGKTRTSSIWITAGAVVLATAAIILTAGAATIVVVGLCAGAAVYGGYTGIQAHLKMKEDLAEIEKLSSECSRTEVLIAWMEATEKSLKSLIDEAEKATRAMSSILTAWQTLCVKMQTVIDELTKANNSKSSGMRTFNALKAAHTGWQKLMEVAEANQRQVFEPKAFEELARQKAA